MSLPRSFTFIGLFAVMLFSANVFAQDSKTPALIWAEGEKVEKFWERYIRQKGGLTWSQSFEYPDYETVAEGDTFMVQLEQGVCLMEFFHGRWRRANDVWRWGDAMNEYGACPYVFD